MTSTLLGTLGSAVDVIVDDAGTLHLPDSVEVGWWIGAADRWHLPAEETGTQVSQQRVDGMPVVETSVRVPGGQIIHRAWCVAGPEGDVAVVELENRSRDAVAVAVVLTGRAVTYDGDRTLTTGSRPILAIARRPARVAAGLAGAVRATVLAGDAPIAEGPTTAAATVAAVLPLAHTACLRLAAPLAGGVPADLSALPSAGEVAAGWRSHLDAATRVVLPDERFAEAIAAARAALLIGAERRRPPGEAAAVALALEGWGHHAAATTPVADLVDEQRLDGSFGNRRDPELTATVLAAWAAHARVMPDAAALEPLVGPAAKAAHRLGKVRFKSSPPAWWTQAQLDAADLLDRALQPDASLLCRSRAAMAPTPSEPAPGSGAITPDPEAGSADAAADAELLRRVRAGLVDDAIPGELALLRSHPAEWLGRDLEVHRLPTRAGRLAFAIRWHGARPALLWELDGSARLTVPGLDPSWSSTDPAGEALLGAVEPAGGLPKVVAPLDAEGTPVDDAPPDGVSFH